MRVFSSSSGRISLFSISRIWGRDFLPEGFPGDHLWPHCDAPHPARSLDILYGLRVVVVPAWCEHTPLRLWGFVVSFCSRFRKAPCLGCRSLVVPWSACCFQVRQGNPKNFFAAFWSLCGFASIYFCRYHLYPQVLVGRASFCSQDFSEWLSDSPGECGTSTSIFLNSLVIFGCSIFFSFSSVEEEGHSFCLLSLCFLPLVLSTAPSCPKHLDGFLLPVWQDLRRAGLSAAVWLVLIHGHLPACTELLKCTNPFRCFLFPLNNDTL